MVLLLLPLFLSLPCFFGWAWAEGDLLRQFYPWKELGRQALAAGHLPLWNPYVYCGMPLLGNFQSALAYPPHFLFYFLDFAPALGWHLLFHFFVSGLGLFALARALGLGQRASLLAALGWQCNAFLLARVEFMSALSAYAWTPWILWSVAARKGAAWTAAFVGLQALAGYPLELGYSLMASLAFAWFLGGAFKATALGWAWGLVFGAVQLLPGIEMILHSGRMAGSLESQNFKYLHLSQVLRWFWPPQRQFWAACFSVSIPALLLAPFARGKAARLCLALVAAGLILSFGVGAQLLPNRHPSLALVFAALGLALLSGIGYEQVKERLPKQAYALALALTLAGAMIPWMQRGNRVDAGLYQPSAAAAYFSGKIKGGMRILLTPQVQTELESAGHSTTEAWARFSTWMQANTSAVAGLHDANGYDPLIPSKIDGLLRRLSSEGLGRNEALLDMMGVEAIVDWDARAGRFNSAVKKRAQAPMRAFVAGDLSGNSARYTAECLAEGPNALRIKLPAIHPAGRLYVNDTFYPGWKAWADGKSAAVEPGSGDWEAFRSMAVGAETREVLMKYQPLSVSLGFLLSLLAFLGIIILGQKSSSGVS